MDNFNDSFKIIGDTGYYVPVCDVETCKRSCAEYLGYSTENGALCFNNECYCKEDQDKEPVTQTIDKNTTPADNTEISTETDAEDDWDYKNQGSKIISNLKLIDFRIDSFKIDIPLIEIT